MTLGVDLLCLDSDERILWLKGIVLRRLISGVVLSQDQLDLGLEHDFAEIKRRWSSFDVEAYTGLNHDAMHRVILASGLVKAWDHQTEARLCLERTDLADGFESSLPDRVANTLNLTPISMRGLFDNLRDRPTSKPVVVSEEEYANLAGEKGKHIVVDKNLNDNE